MDDDVLSQGGDHDPSPWPRRLAVIAAVIAVITGGAVYLSRPHHQQAPAAHATASPAPGPAGLAAPGPPPGPHGISGRTLSWNPSLRLPNAGPQPAWFSPASGGTEPIGGLPANTSGYRFTRVVGGWAVQPSPVAPVTCGGCAGPPTAVWFLPDGARSVTRVGTANLVAPAASAGAVWLTSYPPGANVTTTNGTAREAGTAGALSGPVTLPPGYAIDQGTDRGLLLAPASPQAGATVSKLWDPSAHQPTQEFDQVLAASPSAIAWTTRCHPQCDVQTLDLATGKHTVVALPAGHSVSGGAFSPDGSLLALQLSFGDTGDGGDLAMQLEVASVTSGRLTAVPGTWVSSDALVAFGWPGGGDNLVAEFNFTTKEQLASWHPGAQSPAVSVVRPGPGQSALSLGG
jgi:hypothetical protein